ncbi:MAG: DUF1015 domain-containing protein [Clostridia bacterium]|nr:DUF1015 domain-containing protein [Clostridia bacterium]
MIFNRANILLPKFSKDSVRMNKWSVVACDQYTSEAEYWANTAAVVGEDASTLNIIVPEIYLNDADVEQRIANVKNTMSEYIKSGLFEEYKNTFVYVERVQNNGAVRRGIVGCVDLEEYDYNAGSKSKIRATEGTVLSRIPPRLKVRTGACIESPHIMMLIDDVQKDIIESNGNIKDSFELIYDFDLMNDSGHITGYKMSEAACIALEQKLGALDDNDAFNAKYGTNESSPLIFAVGDGNHSLATAKAYYDNLKNELGDAAKQSPARFALCELVNLHDDSLVFEAIHRVVFGADGDDLVSELGKMYNISYDTNAEGHKITLVTGGKKTDIVITDSSECLAVGAVQKFLDAYCNDNGCEVDYIHGEDVVCKLCEDGKNVGILLDAMDKGDLYKSVVLEGALPRKTFSMGEACDKRFYVECRNIK